MKRLVFLLQEAFGILKVKHFKYQSLFHLFKQIDKVLSPEILKGTIKGIIDDNHSQNHYGFP